MGTKAGFFRDILFSTDAVGQLIAWFDALDPSWPGWDAQANRFSERVGAHWLRSGQTALIYCRFRQDDFDDLLTRAPPGGLVTVYAQADPYASVREIDEASQNYRELVMSLRSVYWKVRNDPAKVAKIRSLWPKARDMDGQLREFGLQFATFNDGFDDTFGYGDT